MLTSKTNTDCALTAEQIVEYFKDFAENTIEIERLYTDMVLHYIRPAENWNLSPKDIAWVIEQGEMVTDLLRRIDQYRRLTASVSC